ncbi:DciA family protein [Streptomyces sp. NPDC056987]|uniref:DciA family protein n=1 Tax=Streptomyces sp. NPDC056987 TaxID=3345988 RepID=UPI0036445DEF
MTEQTTPTEPTTTSGDGASQASGVDLARLALQQARLAARKNGSEARAPRRRRLTTGKRDGREPSGFGTVLAGLMADRAWELPAAGGRVLESWPDIAAHVAPQLPAHVAAAAFHPETGQLDLRPDSPAYATQLRLITTRIITTANSTIGTDAVRTIHVLPVGSTTLAPRTTDAAPAGAGAATAAAETRKPTCEGYHRALAAHRAAAPVRVVDPAIAQAAERQAAALHAQRERAFPADFTAPDDAPTPIQDGQAEHRRQADASHARALLRARAERARHDGTAPSFRSDPLRSTA